MRRILKIALGIVGLVSAAVALLVVLKFGATAPPTRILEPAVMARSDATGDAVTLPDLVYFGTAWQLLNKTRGMPAVVLGGGYTNARVERTGDGLFFAGIVDRVNRSGSVTDVVIAYAGAQGVGDFIQGNALARDRVFAEPKWAAVVFERVWRDPRYARARIQVTGHSLGAGYAQFVGMEAIARHGLPAVAARVRIVAFGVPNWGAQSARYYRADAHALDTLFTGYTALNDPVITNGGTDRIGVSVYLPPFDGLTGLAGLANVVAAHWPTTYMTALGLPDWLTPAQKAAAIRAVSDRFITGDSYDPDYGAPGRFPIVIQGSRGRDTLEGTPGDDLIAGMGGGDVLSGGAGRDRFLILAATDSGGGRGAADEIVDFAPGDRIDLSRLDGDLAKPGRQAFVLRSGRSFDAPAQVTTWTDGATTWVASNGGAEVLIKVRGARRLTSADFVLAPETGDQRIDTYVSGKAAILR